MAMNENNTFSTDTRAALNAAEQSDFSFDCTQNDGQPLTLSTLQKQAEGLSETRPSAPANRKKVAIVATGGTLPAPAGLVNPLNIKPELYRLIPFWKPFRRSTNWLNWISIPIVPKTRTTLRSKMVLESKSWLNPFVTIQPLMAL